jgi:hypothetical protein
MGDVGTHVGRVDVRTHIGTMGDVGTHVGRVEDMGTHRNNG